MVDIKREFKRAKKDMEALWSGKCAIFEYECVDDEYGITDSRMVEKFTNIPCRIDFRSVSPAIQSESVANVSQVITLLVDAELEIKSGSVVEVTQDGITRKYKHSGVSAMYTNHQEIMLELYEGKV